jgi:hypothetical protein
MLLSQHGSILHRRSCYVIDDNVPLKFLHLQQTKQWQASLVAPPDAKVLTEESPVRQRTKQGCSS